MITWRLFYQRISRWLQFFNSLASSAAWSRWVNSAGDAARVNKKKAKFHLDFISIAPRWNFKFMFIDFRWGFSILPFCVTFTCGSFESNDQTGRRKNHTNSGEIISWEYSRFFLAFTSKAAKSPCVWVQRMTMAAKMCNCASASCLKDETDTAEAHKTSDGGEEGKEKRQRSYKLS